MLDAYAASLPVDQHHHRTVVRFYNVERILVAWAQVRSKGLAGNERQAVPIGTGDPKSEGTCGARLGCIS